jgi:hypothetical protein
MTDREYREQALIDTVPDEAWDAVLRQRPTIEVISILRSKSPLFGSIRVARDTVIDMRDALGIRAEW